MCGFIGFFNQSYEREKNKSIITDMCDRIAHRGPDDFSYYTDDDISMGFRRLSIIDLEGGRQPLFNEDNSMVLTFNGEIYNFNEIREDLLSKGHKFTTKTDSEVILHGYEEYGKDLLPKLRGMFAFAIWDKNKKELFGARDIFGIKPYFYYLKNKTFMYGSEIKSFLGNPAFEKELNEKNIPTYLCFEYIPNCETMFKNVYKLAPASYFTYKDGEFKTEKYYTMEYNIDKSKSIDEYADMISKEFSKSCDVHSISDVEVGCFLSSGVDSSLAAKEMGKRNRIKTFTVGFDDSPLSELEHAKKFAEYAGVDNVNRTINADDYFNIVPKIQYYMDEPLPNPSAIALYFLANMAAEQVKVVLSGEGADELFGGYHYYREPLDYAKYQKLPQGLRTLNASFAKKVLPDGFHGKRFLTRAALPMEKRYIRNDYVFNHNMLDELLAKTIKAPKPEELTKCYFDKCKGLDDVTKMQYVDMQTWLVQDILVKADRMSMANSLELRVPFLDKEMLKVALQIPAEYRLNDVTTKVVLRKAAAKELPPETSKMKKMGFPVPLNDWLKQEKYYNMVKEKFDSDIAKKFFNHEFIMKLLNDHRDNKAKNMKKIWSIYSFVIWYEQYFVNA